MTGAALEGRAQAHPLGGCRCQAFESCAPSGAACSPASATEPASDEATWQTLRERADELQLLKLVARRKEEARAADGERQVVAQGAPVRSEGDRCGARCAARETEERVEGEICLD